MTINEAIEHIDEVIANNDCAECIAEHQQLKEWLEYREPKKPIEEYDWRCPRCIHKIAYAGDIYRHRIRFCDRCGQAIDWSDDED